MRLMSCSPHKSHVCGRLARATLLWGILAAMTNLKTAHAAHALALFGLPAPLGAGKAVALGRSTIAFYATAATVIPVLFLAIAVQSSAYLDAFERMAERIARKLREAAAGGNRASAVRAAAAAVLMGTVAVYILIAGSVGEMLAINSLAWGKDTLSNRLFVRLSALQLIWAVVVGPAIRLFKPVVRILKEQFEILHDVEEEPHPAAPAKNRNQEDASTAE